MDSPTPPQPMTAEEEGAWLDAEQLRKLIRDGFLDPPEYDPEKVGQAIAGVIARKRPAEGE